MEIKIIYLEDNGYKIKEETILYKDIAKIRASLPKAMEGSMAMGISYTDPITHNYISYFTKDSSR